MLTVGTRVELHPAMDAWMRGDRYGEVVGFGRARPYTDGKSQSVARPYRVKLDKSGKVIRCHPEWVTAID